MPMHPHLAVFGRLPRLVAMPGRFGLPLLALAVLLAAAAPSAAQSPAEPSPAPPTLDELRRAAVRVEAEVPPDATTAGSLGLRRSGNGIVIDGNGLILTIGYLILEAMTVDVTDHSGRRLPAEILAYDFNTGFGLVRALVPLDARPLPLGSSGAVAVGDRALVLGHAREGGMAPATVSGRREFSGGWEYLLEEAIYTVPPFSHFGGAGLVDSGGRLVGIGSLAVGDAGPEAAGGGPPGNVFVPIDLLPPILEDLGAARRGVGARHPWLGLYTVDFGPGLLVQRVTPGGPADKAGLEAGQVILALEGEPFENQGAFYRRVWALGEPGVEVPLQVLAGRQIRDVRVLSADRYDFLKLDPSL